MTEEEVEIAILTKGLTAPRITPENIDATIKVVHYFRVPNTTTTICALILTNNYVVLGHSASVSMANFDEDIGKQVAYRNAREQIWALEGYRLKDKLYNEAS